MHGISPAELDQRNRTSLFTLGYGCSTMPIYPPRRPMWFIAAGVALAALFVLFFSLNPNGPGTGAALDKLSHATEIPPTFYGMRWFYALTIAMTVSMSALAQGAIIENFRFIFSFKGRWQEPAKVTVINEMILLAVIFVGITPDAVLLLAWGERAAPTYSSLAAFDRAMDFIAGGLFVIYMFRRIRSRPVALFQLQRDPIPMELQPTLEQMRPKLLMIGAILAIAFGVAFGK